MSVATWFSRTTRVRTETWYDLKLRNQGRTPNITCEWRCHRRAEPLDAQWGSRGRCRTARGHGSPQDPSNGDPIEKRVHQ